MSENTLFIELKGRLGNNMFQVAAALNECVKYGKQIQISETSSFSDKTYWSSWLHKMSQYKRKQCTKRSSVHDPSTVYVEDVFQYKDIPRTAQHLTGYFQSKRYMNHIWWQINKIFCLPSQLELEIRSKYAYILDSPDRDKYIVLHIRRGDYLLLPKLHGILNDKYFQTSLSRMQSILNGRGKAIVFSDDIAWCRQQQWLDGSQFIDEPCEVSALWIMSQFHNYIMSNSSFSWWAVMLNGEYKHVIAPDAWFGPDGPQDYQDIYEDNWILHPVDGLVSNLSKSVRSNVTVVTSMYPQEYGLDTFTCSQMNLCVQKLCQLNVPIVLFVPDASAPHLDQLKKSGLAWIVERHFDSLPIFNQPYKTVFTSQFVSQQEQPISSIQQFALRATRPLLVEQAMQMNVYNSNYFVWMDASHVNYLDNGEQMSKLVSSTQTICTTNRVTFLRLQTLDTTNTTQDSQCRLCERVFVGNIHAWMDFLESYKQEFVSISDIGVLLDTTRECITTLAPNE